MNCIEAPGADRAMNSSWPLGRTSRMTILPLSPAAITPAFAYVLLAASRVTRALIVPSAIMTFDTWRYESDVPQMSVPYPKTVNLSWRYQASPRWPIWAALTSYESQPAGTL